MHLTHWGLKKFPSGLMNEIYNRRKAVEKLGAILEGILRENVYLLDGYKRNTCCYGILKNEWENFHQLDKKAKN